MSGILWLDWAVLAVSLHNTILFLWWGLTIWLNAERRTWGIGFVSGGLGLASVFFFSHTAILGLGLNFADEGLDFWWHVGWIPILILPFGWYATTLWYGGYWDDSTSRLHRRHRPGFVFALVLTMVILIVFANSLPSFAQAANLQIKSGADIAGVPAALVAYLFDILVCIVLSLDALRHPEPSQRMMGDIARDRARPWLIAAAIVLLGVGLLVAWVVLWVMANAHEGIAPDETMIVAVAGFDLVIAALIAVTIIAVGQAVARYEIFTGKILPRRGLVRQWNNAIILAVGYGVVIGWSLAIRAQVIYAILLTMAILTTFYALSGWRTYAERDRYMRQLRPFITSQNLYHQLLKDSITPVDVDVAQMFRALCSDVLGAQMARLVPVGPLAPLVPPLAFPSTDVFAHVDVPRFESPQTICTPIGASEWAVPLWSDRGLSGVLLLGAKSDDGIYAQEEIEIARAAGERLIDTCASAELARRLMALQRQRLAETQLLDRRARRVLHDDVLPQLHTAILALGDANAEAIHSLANTHRQISNLLHDLPSAASPEVARLGLFGALRRMVEQEWQSSFDGIVWQIEPAAEDHVTKLAATTAEVLFYAAREAIRNSARYGRGDSADRALHLRVEARCRNGLEIVIEDDGVGQSVKRSEQGSGQGLALHSTMLAVVGGTLAVEPSASGGTRVTLSLANDAQ